MINITNFTDEELRTLLEETTIRDGNRVWHSATIVNEIGRREALRREPGSPGTLQNPIIRNGKAYVYTKYNHLALWEDYEVSLIST